MTTSRALLAAALDPTPVTSSGPAALLGLVTTAGRAALPALLQDAQVASGATALVLRDPAGELVALAGDPRAALPLPRAAGTTPALPLQVAGVRVGTLTVHSAAAPLPAGVVEALAVALALPRTDAATLLAEADAERDDLADALHDGVLQTLVAARYAADLARRDATAAPEVGTRVQAALAELRELVWRLRPRAGEPLGDLLHALARRSGGRLAVDTDAVLPGSAADPGAEAFAYRVLVAALDAVPAAITARLVDVGGGLVLAIRTGDRADALRLTTGCAHRAAALGVGVDTSGTEVLLRLPDAGLTTPTQLDPTAGTPSRTARQTGTDR